MANIKTTLDTRRIKSDGTYNIIYRITHFKKVYTINSNISIYDIFWNSTNRRIESSHPNSKLLNLKLSEGHYQIEQALLQLDDNFNIDKLKLMLDGKPHDKSSVTFLTFANELIEQMMMVKRTGNAIVYQTGVNRLIDFAGKDVLFEDIDYDLLDRFMHHLKVSGLKQNSISNYLRSIRAIYNKAIKKKIVNRACYPFNDITIKSEKTPKRAISREDIRSLLALPLDKDSITKRSLDYFMLSFYFRGISFTDMAYLKSENIIDGRLYYKRRKTSKQYNIYIFKSAETILQNFHQIDQEYLLPVLPNGVVEDSLEAKKIIQQWIKTTNKYLKRLSQEINSKTSITTYSSRHSFGSIAKHLGYPNELIAEALGHEYGNKITNIYLEAFDTAKVDALHKNVIF